MTRTNIIVAALLATATAACDRAGGSAPVGQVVATVDGQEITANELALELGGAKASTPEAQRQLERSALQAIVNRKILAKAADDQELTSTPVFAVRKAKADDLAAINALESKLVAGVPTPSREEAERFVAEHLDSFGQRKLMVVEQLLVPSSAPDLLRAMESRKTMPEIEQLLQQRNIEYRRALGAIDGAVTDPELVKRIVALPAGEIFAVPSGGGVIVSRVTETRIDPLTGPRAIETAQAILKQRRTRDLVGKQMQQMIAAGASRVQYNANYGPPATGKANAKGGTPAS